MNHSIRHDLEHQLARLATARALESYQAQFSEYQPRGHWRDADHAEVAFTVLGRTLTGSVTVGARSIDLALEVPLAFRMFRGAALAVIEREIEGWIEKARRGELSA